MSQQQAPDMDESSEQRPRSPSNTASIKEKSRPKSRGSTTSLQSVGVGNAFQPTPPLQPAPMPMSQNNIYAQPPQHAQQHIYQQGMMMLQQPSNMQPIQPHPGMPHARTMSQTDIRPNSQHGLSEVQPYIGPYANAMPGWNMHPPPHMQHIRHGSEQYEGSPAPEDSNNESRRKKSSANTLANDQELRRLLAQYQHRSLPDVASEVQKNEGAGGKSEKAKQVFAMLWLQESCSRSNQSVRRDLVFAKYTERCGDMRVPTLNAASFGKLVRIIFPNMQTRRLGVRGESKYHYVDLSLNDGDADRQFTSSFDRPSTAGGLPNQRRESMVEAAKPVMNSMSSLMDRPPSRMAMETADFPAPRILTQNTTEQREEDIEPALVPQNAPKLDCKYSNTTTIRLPVRGMTPALLEALPSVRADMPGTLATYVAMPNANSLTPPPALSQDNPFELPDIFPYLEGQNYDPLRAQALHHLYRSYCIDVIDAFRKCKEKPFFNHHRAFNGKMTVPVAKLFTMKCLAPWIHESDMRMYKQIVRFLAPLALQNVPEMVWGFCERISSKLVPSLITTFEEKCPVHVVIAKAIPAARFTNLLKKLKDANVATLQLSKMLIDPQQRTQMWLDLMVMVEPDRLLDDSMPPPESFVAVQGILKHDLRTLIEPVEGGLVNAAEDDPTSGYANLLHDNDSSSFPTTFGVLNTDGLDPQTGLLEKWISWLESLPQAFVGHHPQCMMDWHTKFWRSLMMQVGQGGAHSYQSWWYVEAFAQQMLAWICEMQGMLMSEEDQKNEDRKEAEKKAEAALIVPRSRMLAGTKRKRNAESDEDTVGEERLAKQPALQAPSMPRPDPKPQHELEPSTEPEEPTLPEMPDHAHQNDEDTDAEMDEITRGGPLDLPSIHTGLTSPVKLQPTQGNMHHGNMAKHIMQHHGGNNSMIDDSGIDLGIDGDDHDHDESIKEARKFNKRDWLLSSDPVDVQGSVGFGVVV